MTFQGTTLTGIGNIDPPDPDDGCPNLDEDSDGIPIHQDKCPSEPETVKRFEDDDGCPDQYPV